MTHRLAGLLAVLALLAFKAEAAPVDTGHLLAELHAQTQGVAPGRTVQVALRQKIDRGWHTYWRNPGDSGEATQLTWSLPPGWTAGEIVWAAPRRLPVGPLVNYGYSGEVLLPVAITAPADAAPGSTAVLRAKAAFLVCEEICIPEEAELQITLPVVAGAPVKDPKWGPAIEAALAASPREAGLQATFQAGDDDLRLAVVGAALTGADVSAAYFFPFSGGAIDHAKPQKIELGPDGLTLTIGKGFAFQDAAPPELLGGVLSVGTKAYEISAVAGPAPAGASGLGSPAASPPRAAAGLGLPLAAAFAFLGGLILNLMPCVFPILAMKAASLAGHGHEISTARRQGLAFGGGVLVTFLLLASAMIGLKAAGATIGWGFQLQSPPVVAALSLLMLAVALNLSGVFEVGTSVQGVGGRAASGDGLGAAFLTGALAVVVAAPCTAPFMAPALGWALTQEAPATLAVFAALGLGFAAPFVAVAFAPGLLARLPRPGPWMETLRRVLAFPMYGAAAWLAWVLTVQSGADGLARLLAAAVVIALASWIIGRAQRSNAQGAPVIFRTAAATILALGAIAVAIWPREHGTQVAAVEVGETPFEAFTPERLAALRAQGRPVLVNFTAAWCVTCQVNEKVALSQAAVRSALTRTDTVYLKADWTKKDAVIAAELARHGRAGVPLYLLYGKGGADAVILPQILTEGLVVRALEKAAKG